MQLKVWRIENLRIEGPNSRSGGCKIVVWRVQNRSLEGFLAALGAAGRSCGHPEGVVVLPEGVVVRLGGVLEPSWGRFGCVLEGLEAVFGGVLRSSWRHLRLSEGVLALRMEAKRSVPSCISFANRL